MLLADDFFFLAHHETTGRSRLNDGALGLGMAGALLAELVLVERITVADGRVRISDRRPPDDALAHTVLDHLVNNPTVTAVRDWLRFLRQDANHQVGQRLLRAGQVRTIQVRRLLRTNVGYVPVDINTAAWPAARLAVTLGRGQPLATQDLVLTGLATATGLDTDVLHDVPASAQRALPRQLATIPPPLRELLAETETAVGEAVLTHRT